MGFIGRDAAYASNLTKRQRSIIEKALRKGFRKERSAGGAYASESASVWESNGVRIEKSTFSHMSGSYFITIEIWKTTMNTRTRVFKAALSWRLGNAEESATIDPDAPGAWEKLL